MALQKEFLIKGYSFSYWKIISIWYDLITKDTVIRIALYKDKDTRLANPHDYVLVKELHLQNIVDETAGPDTILNLNLSVAYQKIIQEAQKQYDPDQPESDISFFKDAVEV